MRKVFIILFLIACMAVGCQETDNFSNIPIINQSTIFNYQVNQQLFLDEDKTITLLIYYQNELIREIVPTSSPINIIDSVQRDRYDFIQVITDASTNAFEVSVFKNITSGRVDFTENDLCQEGMVDVSFALPEGEIVLYSDPCKLLVEPAGLADFETGYTTNFQNLYFRNNQKEFLLINNLFEQEIDLTDVNFIDLETQELSIPPTIDDFIFKLSGVILTAQFLNQQIVLQTDVESPPIEGSSTYEIAIPGPDVFDKYLTEISYLNESGDKQRIEIIGDIPGAVDDFSQTGSLTSADIQDYGFLLSSGSVDVVKARWKPAALESNSFVEIYTASQDASYRLPQEVTEILNEQVNFNTPNLVFDYVEMIDYSNTQSFDEFIRFLFIRANESFNNTDFMINSTELKG